MKSSCHTPQRQALALTLFLATASAGLHAQAPEPKQRQAADFAGTWQVQICDPSRPAADGCGGFTIHLFQQGERLCGTHFGATANLSRLDEGEPRSIVGAAAGRKAVMTVRSTRANTTGNVYLAVADLTGQALQWRLIDTVLETGGDNVIAQKATLRKQASRPDDASYQAAQQACLASFKETSE